jgi:hypothetical protein
MLNNKMLWTARVTSGIIAIVFFSVLPSQGWESTAGNVRVED